MGKGFSSSVYQWSIHWMLHPTVKAPFALCMGVSCASSHSLVSICASIVYSPIWLTMTLMSCHYPPLSLFLLLSFPGGKVIKWQLGRQKKDGVCVCVCDAYTFLKAAAINCEGGGLASQPASIAPIRLDIGGAGPRSKSSRWVVTGDGLVQEVWLNLGRSCTICFYGGHLSNAALHNENKRTS